VRGSIRPGEHQGEVGGGGGDRRLYFDPRKFEAEQERENMRPTSERKVIGVVANVDPQETDLEIDQQPTLRHIGPSNLTAGA
jgi:hypothetical protein